MFKTRRFKHIDKKHVQNNFKKTRVFGTTVYREFTALQALKYASRANDCYVNKTLGQQLCAVCVPLGNESPIV